MSTPAKSVFIPILFFIFLWLGIQFLLPLAMPFLLGGVLALSAEPLVRLLNRRCRLPRSLGAGIGVSLSFLALSAGILGLLSLLFRGLKNLTGILPELVEGAQAGIHLLESWLLGLADRGPDSLRPILSAAVTDFFYGGTDFLQQGAAYIFSLAGGLLTHIPDQAFRLITTVISGFMISARLPAIRSGLRQFLSREKFAAAISLIRRVRKAVFHWLLAQLKLSGITMLILLAGMLFLRIPHAPVWAVSVALLDALPLLGTGTVLLPWSLISLLRGDQVTALGLAACYLCAALTRSMLEPRFVGRQLGLDPLITLASLYCGYRLWGFGGMILSPLLTITLFQLVPAGKTRS